MHAHRPILSNTRCVDAIKQSRRPDGSCHETPCAFEGSVWTLLDGRHAPQTRPASQRSLQLLGCHGCMLSYSLDSLVCSGLSSANVVVLLPLSVLSMMLLRLLFVCNGSSVSVVCDGSSVSVVYDAASSALRVGLSLSFSRFVHANPNPQCR
jgi:hypothetical protein